MKDLSVDALNLQEVAQRVADGAFPGVTSDEISDLCAETCASRVIKHFDYGLLAGRIAVAKLHKKTKSKFSEVVGLLYENTDEFNGEAVPLVSKEFHDIVKKHQDLLDEAIDTELDFEYLYFGYKTLERAYLLRVRGEIVERPQHMIMRVAVGIHGDDMPKVLETYKLMSQKYFTHASPTLFNAGTRYPQLSSCFLLGMEEDSINGIYETLRKCANISKTAGGIGIHMSNIRAAGSFISGTNGTSNGLVPMLRVFNDTARFVDQGGNRRPGAIAVYIEPWHADIFDVLDLKKNHGKEESRARDIFYALWIPDLFMKKVEANEDWSLFSPSEAKGLENVYGEEFEKLYNRYVSEGRQRKTIKAQKLWFAIITAQTETGQPFMVYKDACNRKSNQKNLGTIKSSNLCTEIVEYSSKDEVAVCNLASVALPKFVRRNEMKDVAWYDFKKLHKTVKTIVQNLDKIIDINYYPLEEAERSNMRHRPIAVGVQGLADTFLALRLTFESKEAKLLNIQIAETIYHAAVEKSIELAEEHGSYSTYEGSPASKGLLQFDLWDHKPTELWNWQLLKDKMANHGIRNSLLVAPMPTASTSNIMGLNESFEPYTSNIYIRRVSSGEFQIANRWMMQDLMELGMWDNEMRNEIIKANGSIQKINRIPQELKDLYKTVWEMSQKTIIDMAADRGPFVDQSQSLNIHMKDVTPGKLTSMHFYGWKKGLKTGMYYLRTQAAAAAIQFTVDSGVSQKRHLETSTISLKRARYLQEAAEDTLEENSRDSSRFSESPEVETRGTSCSVYTPDACEMCSG